MIDLPILVDDSLFDAYDVQKARRNRGMPLEALALDTTPVGMHYLLAHFDIPIFDPDTWSLGITGHVKKPLTFNLEQLRRFPRMSQIVTIECAGNGRTHIEPRPPGNPWGYDGVSTSIWSGVSLQLALNEAEILKSARSVVFSGADFGERLGRTEYYKRALSLEEAASDDMLLAFEMSGRPLEPQQGAPLRLVAPGWYGMAHVKWLTGIELIDHEFDGPQHEAYRIKQSEDELGEPVTKMKVRSLMIPPGYPENSHRHRLLEPGLVTLQGRAWSGTAEIERVEVGINNVWAESVVEPAVADRKAWQGWTYQWGAESGEHLLRCRATDALGNTQPLVPSWNLRGLANNAVQQVAVTVR
ncbi:MAG: sulfite oxidase [Actinobacteria bacterium]|nr:sulfite oxidase [Actinomycetota bacterium]